MNAWLMLVPLISAVCGWLLPRLIIMALFYTSKPENTFGSIRPGIFAKNKKLNYDQLAKVLTAHFFSSGEIQEMILSPEIFKKISPDIEMHIDHFLSVTLKEKMPVVGMLIGERTISQMKSIFMDELETLFPVVIDKYMDQLISDGETRSRLLEKLSSIPAPGIKGLIYKLWSKELLWCQWAGLLAGLMLGAIELILFLTLSR